jgi:hypothetical protein
VCVSSIATHHHSWPSAGDPHMHCQVVDHQHSQIETFQVLRWIAVGLDLLRAAFLGEMKSALAQ